MKSESDLMQIEEATSPSDNVFDYLPTELLQYVAYFLDLQAYINFAWTAKALKLALTNNTFIKAYDPLLATVLKVSLHYTGKNFDATDQTSLAVIEQVMLLYTRVKITVLSTEIEIDEAILMAMLDCHLAGINNEQKQLKFDFLFELFGNYFKLRSNFIFDIQQWLATILTDPVKFNFLMTYINQDEQRSLTPATFGEENAEKMTRNPVVYLFAKHTFLVATKIDDIDKKRIALLSAEKNCLRSYKAGAKNSIFLLLAIFNYLNSNQLPMQTYSKAWSELEKEAAELLGIETSGRSIFEMIPGALLEALCVAPTKGIRIFKKLLANNSIDELQTLNEQFLIWSLIRGTHSLEFLNGFRGKAKKLQELTPVLKTICDSPNAFIIGEILHEEALLPALPKQWKTDNFIQQQSKLTKRALWQISYYYKELKRYYPLLSFVEFSSKNTRKAVIDLLSKNAAEEKLARLTQISFPVLIKIILHAPKEFFDFLISEDSTDLLHYFQVIYPNLLNTANKKQQKDILAVYNFLYPPLLSRYYKYFKKAGFTIPKILQTANETLSIVKDWLATHEYLFEKWTGKDIAKFIKLIHLRDSQKRQSNTDIFLSTLAKTELLKDSQGEVIIFKDFKKLIESKITWHMKAETCGLLYQQLGLEKLKQCSQTELIVNHCQTNLLQELSKLMLDPLTQVLAEAQGKIEILKQLIVRLTKSTELLLPLKIPNRMQLSSSFFSIRTRKRTRDQAAEESTASNKTLRPSGGLEGN